MSIDNEHYGERKCLAASLAIASLIFTGGILPGACLFFFEEAITEARKKRRMQAGKLAG